MNAETLKLVVLSGAVSAAVSFGVVHAASVTPRTQASAAETQHAAVVSAVPAAEARSLPRTDGIAESSSLEIREAHSDGGYWEEREREGLPTR